MKKDRASVPSLAQSDKRLYLK